MHSRTFLIFLALLAFLILPRRPAHAQEMHSVPAGLAATNGAGSGAAGFQFDSNPLDRAPDTNLALLAMRLFPLPPLHAEDKASVLAKLDAAAKDFHTTSANFKFDSIQTDPVPDTDEMTGITYYARNGGHFQWGAHVTEHNGHPAIKTYIYSGGVLRVSDTGKESDAKAYSQAGKYESYFALGFGASGKELEEQWTIKYLGKEKIGDIETDKLELVAKDPQVRKNIPKVTVWMDTAHAVSLKLVFDEGEGQSRVCTYSQIQVNQPLPKTAFSFDK